jgi:hypothetical protein
VNRAKLGCVEVVEQAPGALSQFAVGHGLGVTGQARREQMRVAVDRAVDRVDRFGRRENQRQLEPVEQRPKRLVNPSCVLTHASLPAFGALDPADGCRVSDRRLADRARDVCWELGDLDFRGLEVGCDLEQTDAVLGEREHERAVWEGDRAQQRLEVEAIRDLDETRSFTRFAASATRSASRGWHRKSFADRYRAVSRRH